MDKSKRAVSIYLGADVYARIEAVAKEENRSISNYLGGLLERAHPPLGVVVKGRPMPVRRR